VPEKLFSAEQTIKQLLPIHREHSFFLVTGKQIDDWYQNEQILVSSLRQLKQQNQLKDFQAISAFWPDQSLQRQNYQLLKHTVYQADFLKRYMTDLGFDENAYAKEVNDFKLAENLTISLTTWLNSNEKLKSQWLGCNENGCQSIVSLMGIKELATLESLAKSDAVSWVNHTGEMSGLFKRYRFDVSILIIIVCTLIYCGLLLKLGRLNAARIMAVPVVSMLSALATLGIFNQLFSLFNLFALLLVLEIGIDYAFFFYMAGQDQNVDEKRTSTSLAVTLSAFTTLLSYGLLATCTTTIVHTFGLTLLVGVLVAFLLSPLVGVVR
jgi:predicted exporter